MPIDVQGHRGARGRRPENTLPAFRYALECGVDTLELDTAITQDGVVVVSHEPWFSHEICSRPDGTPLRRHEARRLRIAEMTLETVHSYDCGRRQHPDFPHQQPMPAVKPTLREVIERAERFCAETGRMPVRYNIETKTKPEWEGRFHPDHEEVTRAIYRLVGELGVLDRTTLQSFDPRTLRVARRLDRRWRLSLLTSRWPRRTITAQIGRLGFTPEIISPDHHLVDRAYVERASALGVAVLPWTVNDLGRMRELVRYGVAGFITDYPDRGVQVREET